jgi:hypothetical protein
MEAAGEAEVAMVETNPPRNNWPQTHQDDGTGGEADKGRASDLKRTADRIDRFADALKKHDEWLRLPRLFGAAAGESVCCCSGSGISPALRRSFGR